MNEVVQHSLYAKLLRKLLHAAHISESRWDDLISIYVERPDMNSKQRTDSRHKFRTAVKSPTLTYVYFMRALKLLGAVSIKVKLEVTFRDDPTLEVEEHIAIKKDSLDQ